MVKVSTKLGVKGGKRHIRNVISKNSGFSIVETIASATILASLVATTVTIVGLTEQLRYQSSLRDAIRQTVDADIEEMKQRLFEFRYVANDGTQAKRSCYTTDSTCNDPQNRVNIDQSKLFDTCRRIAYDFLRQQSGNVLNPWDSIITPSGSTHTVFKSAPVVIRRSVKASPSLDGSVNTAVTLNTDSALLRITYRVVSKSSDMAQVGLTSQSMNEVLRTVTLYNDAHPYCDLEQHK